MKLLKFILLLILFLTLVACSKPKGDNHRSTKGIEIVAFCEMDSEAICAEGIVYHRNNLLHFADFSTGESIVLCYKPNCKHIPYDRLNNPEPYCDAALPFSHGSVSFIYNSILYTFASDIT